MLQNQLRKLRLEKNLTQDAVAQHLCVSSQTVSKWERGLLSPDISLLPKIALLYDCSIDFLFEMNAYRGAEHRKLFLETVRKLGAEKDWEGVYRAFIREIERNPEDFSNYPEVMRCVLLRKLFDDAHIQNLISLSEYAEKHCLDDDVRNEIYRYMLQICSASQNEQIKKKTAYFYRKLPMMRHSREIMIRFAAKEDTEYREQLQKNIFYTVDLAECSIRQLIRKEMPPEKQLFYYRKAAALYEIVLDGKFGGFFDVPLLCDYGEMMKCYLRMDDRVAAEQVFGRFQSVLERHFADFSQSSDLLFETEISGHTSSKKSCLKLLDQMLNDPIFEPFRKTVAKLKQCLLESA